MHICMFWKQEPCAETNISTSKYSRLPFTNKDFTPSHMLNLYTRSHPVTSLLVFVCPQSPPSAVGFLRVNTEASGERGRFGGGGADGHTIHFLQPTQKLPSPGHDSGRRDGCKLKEHPSSTCRLLVSQEKFRNHMVV